MDAEADPDSLPCRTDSGGGSSERSVVAAALREVETLSRHPPPLWDTPDPSSSSQPPAGVLPSRYFLTGSLALDYGRPMFSCYVDDMLPSPWTRHEKRNLEKLAQSCASTVLPTEQPHKCCDQDIDYSIPWEEVARKLGTKDAKECFMMYSNEVDPAVSRSPWTDEENKKLLDLVAEYEEHDWVSIAHELRTRRTPLQCLQHYQQCLNLHMAKNEDWSAEELSTLRETVATCGERNWQHVAAALPGRSMRQVMSRWRRVKDAERKVGPYTDEEEKRLFLAALALEVPTHSLTKRRDDEISALDAADDTTAKKMLLERRQVKRNAFKRRRETAEEPSAESLDSADGSYSGIWMQLSRLHQGRDEVQVREKWLRDMDPTVYRNVDFSEQEDARLLRMVRLIGPGNWTVCSEWMPGRPDDQVLRRWQKLTCSSISYPLNPFF